MEKLTQQNIQEAFLNNARKDKTFLTIYLMSGVKLSGRIKSFDKYSVILEASNQEQLIFKHAISTVVISKSAHSSGPHPGPGYAGSGAADAASDGGHEPGVAQPIAFCASRTRDPGRARPQGARREARSAKAGVHHLCSKNR